MSLKSGLTGARVLVTGASQGIGFAAAHAFLEEGARVVINSSNPERLGEAVRRLTSAGEVHGVVADLTQKAGIEKVVGDGVRALGGLDTLVYVTGSPKPGIFMEQGFAEWEAAARLLMISPAYLARTAAEAMMRSGPGGRMVFSASLSIREPIPTIATSNVARIAIAGLVRTLARELGPKGVRVNGVMPGYILTDRIEEVARDRAKRRGTTPELARKELESEIPLGRMGTPEELARVFVFLGSDMSSYVSGALVPVDGALARSVG
jgi:3-oxoacyl-[acyl-carrier protein] reductase